MSDRVRLAIILAEDARSATLLRRYITRAVNVQDLRVKISPKGEGSAFDWIISQYPIEVREQRRLVSAKNPNHAILAVHIDADKLEVTDRLAQLASAIADAGLPVRQIGERIAICVPKRNTETWIYGLTGMSVDEVYDFKRDPQSRVGTNPRQRLGLVDQKLKPAIDQLYVLTRRNAAPVHPSMQSVAAAVQELRRLEV